MKKKIWLIPVACLALIAVLWFSGLIPKQIARIAGTNYVKEHFPEMELECVDVEWADVFGDYLISFKDKDGNEYSCVIGPTLFPTSLGQGLFAISDYYNEHYSVSNNGGADGPASITTTADVEDLKEKYPEYFDLPTDKGLWVYVWQMAGNSYSCGLLSGKNLGYTQEELWELHISPATLEEMRTIVAYYISNEGVAKDQVVICPIAMPHSSYYYNIDEAYRKALEEKFWKDLPIVETTEWGSPIIDVTDFDIDADGTVERCVLAYGPTSGLFTIQLTVTENGVDEYSDIYYLSFGEFSFVETDEGMKLRRLPAKEDEEPTDYSSSVKDGNIVLTADGEDISSLEQ